jgi:hypothetical protein
MPHAHQHAGVPSPSASLPPAPALPLSLLVPALMLALPVAVGVALLADTAAAPASASGVDALAREFTRLALAFAQHKPDEVDSYFGPASLRPAQTAPRIPLATLSQRAHRLVAQLDSGLASDRDTADRDTAGLRARPARLRAEAGALATVIAAAGAASHAPPPMPFEEEARRIYGITFGTAAEAAETRIDAARAALERALPQAAAASTSAAQPQPQPQWQPQTLAARFDEYRRRFVIPADRRRAVFEAALHACRARTVAHWTLPAGEHLDVKWDIAAPAAWHRYEGHGRSTLTINPAALTFVDTAVDLACHEGYPGHHVQFLLADRAALAGAGVVPVEETVALLRSPVAMLREAAANYAVDLAFPPEERLRFERDTLFPIAGLDPSTAAGYFEVRQLVRALEPAIIPILRDYRDGRLTEADAADRLERRALASSPQALLRFADDLGPYVLGYTIARDRVAAYVARQTRAGRGDAWTVLEALLMKPDPARVFSSISISSAAT